MDTLAVTYAAAGRFDKADTTTQKALELIDPEQKKVIKELKDHHQMYKKNNHTHQK